MTNLWNVHAYDPLNAKNCDIIQVFQFCLWTLSEIKYYIYVQIHPHTHQAHSKYDHKPAETLVNLKCGYWS